MQLSEKLSIVTGGGGGFGQEISLTLARTGSAIVVVDMDEKRAEDVAPAGTGSRRPSSSLQSRCYQCLPDNETDEPGERKNFKG